MTLNLFSWLRRRVSEAIVSGVADALDTLDAPPEADSPAPSPLAGLLAARLSPRPALPGGDADQADQPAQTEANGRSRKRA